MQLIQFTDSGSWRIYKLEKLVTMFSKLQFHNLLIYENISNFLQVQSLENLQNTTVNINLYKSLYLL